MKQIRTTILLLAVGLTSAPLFAASVAELEKQIQQRQSEYDNFNASVLTQTEQAAALESQLADLRKNAELAEADRQTALIEMNQQYEALVEDPSLDIGAAQNNYAKAVRTHKDIKLAITDKYNAWQGKILDIERLQVSKHSLLNTLESLKEQLNSARVDRLYKEFNRKDAVVVSHNVSCDKDETLAKCMERGKNLAKQKASKRFLDFLYDGLSESVEAERRRASSDAYIQVLRSEVDESNFSGQGVFNVRMSLELQGNLKRNQGCELLGLDQRYCLKQSLVAEQSADNNSNAQDASQESAMYELTVRSNVYDDEVFIDGVSYGSTRLQVMLPAGEHDVQVVKRGYESFRQNIQLRESMTLKVELPRTQYAFSKGERIQDILAGDLPGPNLVVIPSGNFRMGDISGEGLENERPIRSQELSRSFGITEYEITVGAFGQFVADTGYVTDAEREQGCASYQNGQAVFNNTQNWRNPGFSQSEQHPAVCLSVADAQAYANWLSSNSGQTYRLPTEAEWEYAARGGQETDYWWGNGIGTDNANCGWCGSQWSNQSSAPAGSFERNEYGLFDTVGNVWEWALSDNAPGGAVVRGGAWNFAPRLARVSTRMEIDPSFRANYIGFRVLREQ